MPTITEFQTIRIEVPEGATSTTEVRDGVPVVRRYFVDLVVVALSVDTADRTDVASALGSVVAAYRHRPGYSRTITAAPSVPGSTAADATAFSWTSDESFSMRSHVVCAADADIVVTAHAAYPVRFAERCAPIADAILGSLALTASTGSATPRASDE